MHSYSIDTEERRNVICYLTILSMVIYLGLIHFISKYDAPDIITIPTPFVIFGGLYLLFEKVLWKFKIFSFVIKTPNLNGDWQGQYESSYKGMIIPAVLKIKQSWTKAEIISINGDTQSNSSMAGIFTKGGGEISLKFEYNNDSNACMKDGRPSHGGFTNLKLDTKEKILHGSYYTDRNRQTYGSAYFHYVSTKQK